MPVAPSRPVHRLPAATLPDALRLIGVGDAVRVATAEDGTLLGRFQGFDGETLVLTLSGDTDADVPASAIRRIARPRHRTAEGAAVGAFLGAAPFVYLMALYLSARSGSAPADDRLIGGLLFVGLVLVTGALTVIGALAGGAINHDEPLFVAPDATR